MGFSVGLLVDHGLASETCNWFLKRESNIARGSL